MIAENTSIFIECAGDSLTSGFKPATYPRTLNRMFHQSGLKRVQVKNRGFEGFAVDDYLKHLGGPGVRKRMQHLTINYVLLLLGTNDTRSTKNTPAAVFEERYRALAETYLNHANPEGGSPAVYPLTIPWYYQPISFDWRGETHLFENAERIVEEFNPIIQSIADDLNLDTIDIHTPLREAGPEAFIDGLHPNPMGCEIIATACHDALYPRLRKHFEVKAD